jgi:hypothetical protein
VRKVKVTYRLALAAGCLVFAIGGQAQTPCQQSDRIGSVVNLTKRLEDRTVCATRVNAANGDHWQEWHQADGTLTEYAKGPDDPVDPTHDVGSWTVTGTDAGHHAVVNYKYTDGSSFTFRVYRNGPGRISFCTDARPRHEVATATLRNGQRPCRF